MRRTALLLASALIVSLAAPAVAKDSSSTPENTASPGKEADKMKSGDTSGSVPNSSNPGSSAGADGNKTQDSRTTKTRDR